MTEFSGMAVEEVAVGSNLRVVPQQARGRDKVARLLAAADRVMAAEGVEAITTVRIAAESGVSVGSLYRYLPNRDAIIESLARHYLTLLEQRMDEVGLELAGTSGDVVGLSIDAFADFYRDHPGFRALWFSRHLTEETREQDRAHKLAMAHRIRGLLVERGIGRHDESTLRFAQTIQLTADALIQEAFRMDPRGDAVLLAHLKTMVRSYLLEMAAESSDH
ncbi:TetR/AcrR family transcriptional regulator [Nocardioides limicola]|uniref:TetR/AcrR family transcriptional regulator n=1 Tax=Nocardioides limicola TaxID=2803368 RepID=UPI00193B1ADE|nr:TetR/AcrR family transcriptional regulator [Nocardioides sp. DJM-14]